jgi:hypothetical protein
MPCLRHPARLAALATFVCLLCACQQQNKSVTMEQRIGPSPGITVFELQAEVMGFADTLTTRLSQACDEVMLANPEDRETRHLALGLRSGTGISAYTIATESNPVGSLFDMIVMVTLSRIVVEDYLVGELDSEIWQPVLKAMLKSEADVWAVADKALDQDGQDQLRRLIMEWREANPEQVYVTHIRFSDFAFVRGGVASAAAGKGGNLLSLFMLDPLSGMSPATRQIEQSRLLGERLFFFASRLPFMIDWETQFQINETLSLPEIARVVNAVDEYAVVGHELTALAEKLPDEIAQRVATERKAIIEETGAMIAVQRDAAIEQARQAIATERAALLADLNRQTEALGPLVSELKATLDSGTALTNSIDGIVTKVQARRPKDAQPLEMEDVRASLVEATTTARELNTLTESLDRLLASSEPGRLDELQQTLALVEAGGNRLVNRIFVLALVLVAVIFVASLIMLLIRARTAPGATTIPPAR